MYIFIYRGGISRDMIPRNATHVIIHESVTVIPERIFSDHPCITDLICHAGVKKIERYAFYGCPRLKRVIMPGVESIDYCTFYGCKGMTCVQCDNLEQIGWGAFYFCTLLRSINLQSAKDIHNYAFGRCATMTEAILGISLESVRAGAFEDCFALERLVIPLKNGLMGHDGIFQECANLRRLDLVEGDVLWETITALQIEEWRNDLSREFESINLILPSADPGYYNEHLDEDTGEKAIAIREWIARFLRKIIHYKVLHYRLLNEVATTLQHVALNDVIVDNVIPFLELPAHKFDGEQD